MHSMNSISPQKIVLGYKVIYVVFLTHLTMHLNLFLQVIQFRSLLIKSSTDVSFLQHLLNKSHVCCMYVCTLRGSPLQTSAVVIPD